jgi:outer membrane phospholipase A
MKRLIYKFILVPIFLLVTGNSQAECNSRTESNSPTESFSLESVNGLGEGNSNFQSYRPSYFGVRTNHNNDDYEGEIKFQLSLKYQLTPDNFSSNQTLNTISNNWYFGYTQKSFWSIQESSEPFRETNFAPEFFKEITFNDWNNDKYLKAVRFGLFRHESTGEDGEDSHGWNTSYIEPIYKFGNFSVAPKLWVPALFQSKSDAAPDNEDIFDYYGYGELKVFYKQSPKIFHSMMYRRGNKSDRYGFRWQTDYALKNDFWNPKVFVQYWAGNGESLIDYDNRTYGLVVGLSTVY